MLCCIGCFQDDSLHYLINERGQVGDCSFCKRKGVAVAPPGALSSVFAEMINNQYSPVTSENTAYDDEDGTPLFGDDGDTLFNIIQEDWEIFTDYDDGDKLLAAILDAGWDDDDPEWPSATGTLWTKRSTPLLDRAEGLAESWRWFCTEAKEIRDPDQMKRHPLLSQITLALEDSDSVLQDGRPLYRARKNGPDQTDAYDAPNLGPPPPSKATAGRCNREGLAVFYTAEDVPTAIAEIRPTRGDVVSVGEFVLRREIRVLDASKPPRIPSPFTDDLDWKLKSRRVLIAFAVELSRPVDQPELEPQEYHATQLLSELAWSQGYSAIRYPSGRSQSKNVVLRDQDPVEYVRSWIEVVEEIPPPYTPPVVW